MSLRRLSLILFLAGGLFCLWVGGRAARDAMTELNTRAVFVVVGVVASLGIAIAFAASSGRDLAGSNPDGSLLSQQIHLFAFRLGSALSPNPADAWFRYGMKAGGPMISQACLQKAAAMGHAEACLRLGERAWKGQFGASKAEALPWFRAAAERGSLEGAFRLAEELRWNQADPEAVRSWYLRAAQGGFAPAMERLAMLSERGEGIPADPEAAALWKAQRPTTPTVHSFVIQGATRKAPEWVDRIIEHPATPWLLLAGLALWVLFWLLFLVLFILTFGRFAPTMYFMLLPGLAGLLVLYFSLRPLTRHSAMSRRSARLLDRASGGDTEAAFRMGISYLQGSPDHPKDSLEARRWFKIAAEAGHPEAMFQFSELLAWGSGGPRDAQSASEWLARAAAAGSPAAQAKSAIRSPAPD